MKYLLTILFLLTAYFVNAQEGGYIPNAAAYQYKGLKQKNSLQPPTGIAFPVTATNAPDSNYAAWYYNKADTSFYQFNPVPKTWTKLQSNGGIQVSIDSIFITSIDSIFISNTDSIFIISGNDTIFIGNGNPAVDTIYQRGPDSIFAVKSGVEFLAAVTGTGAPSGGMDTAYSRQDSIFGLKNNGEFLIATSQQTIDSIFITSTDSIFIITTNNDTIFIGTGNGADSIVSFEKNNTQDSIILLLRDGRRLTVKDSTGGGLQDLQSVLTVGNQANKGISITTHDGFEVTDSLDANSYAHLKVQENINGGYLELQNVNGFHGTLYAGNLTSNLGYQFANQTGTIPMSVSVNGGTQIQAGTDGNIDLTVSGGGSSSIILDSFTVDFDGLHPVMSVPISAASAKNIDISSESGSAGGFQFGWNSTKAVLTYQTAIKGTYKFYITYYQ